MNKLKNFIGKINVLKIDFQSLICLKPKKLFLVVAKSNTSAIFFFKKFKYSESFRERKKTKCWDPPPKFI